MSEINDNLVLICGGSKGGKTSSLRNLVNPEGVLYLNCEAGKKPTFPAKFVQKTITDPLQIYAGFDAVEAGGKFKDIHTIIVDSLTFLLEMYVSLHVIPATDGQKAWMNFQQYFKNLMQQNVARSTRNVIFTAHTESILNETEHIIETRVPVQGGLKKNGIEAYFSVVVAAKKVPLRVLEGYENALLNITPDEERIGVKHVYQTMLTKETVNEKLTSPMGMWEINETYIDNDAQLLLNRLKEYYN